MLISSEELEQKREIVDGEISLNFQDRTHIQRNWNEVPEPVY